MKTESKRPTIWFAYQTGMADGYADVVGPFLDGDLAMDFVEARGKNWDCSIMTYPDEWKPLLYPWELKRN